MTLGFDWVPQSNRLRLPLLGGVVFFREPVAQYDLISGFFPPNFIDQPSFLFPFGHHGRPVSTGTGELKKYSTRGPEMTRVTRKVINK